jgi:hypothetical protein
VLAEELRAGTRHHRSASCHIPRHRRKGWLARFNWHCHLTRPKTQLAGGHPSAEAYDFIGSIKGSAGIAKIYELCEDLTSEERLKRILTERLFAELPQLDTDASYVVDVSISCLGFSERNRNEVASPTRHGPRKKRNGLRPEARLRSNGTH